MAKRGGRYFGQMEPYEKWQRITNGMACLENGEKSNKEKVWSSDGWQGGKIRDREQSYGYQISKIDWSQGCKMAYVLLKNFFSQAFKQVLFIFHERLYS